MPNGRNFWKAKQEQLVYYYVTRAIVICIHGKWHCNIDPRRCIKVKSCQINALIIRVVMGKIFKFISFISVSMGNFWLDTAFALIVFILSGCWDIGLFTQFLQTCQFQSLTVLPFGFTTPLLGHLKKLVIVLRDQTVDTGKFELPSARRGKTTLVLGPIKVQLIAYNLPLNETKTGPK